MHVNEKLWRTLFVWNRTIRKNQISKPKYHSPFHNVEMVESSWQNMVKLTKLFEHRTYAKTFSLDSHSDWSGTYIQWHPTLALMGTDLTEREGHIVDHDHQLKGLLVLNRLTDRRKASNSIISKTQFQSWLQPFYLVCSTPSGAPVAHWVSSRKH